MPKTVGISCQTERLPSSVTGKRVSLRAVEIDDVPRLTDWWQEPSTRNCLDVDPRPRSRDHIAQIVQYSNRGGSAATVSLAITTISDSQLVGYIALEEVPGNARISELSMLLGPNFRSQGLGRESAALVVRFGFEELNLNKIEVQVLVENVVAIAAFTAVGFLPEGRRRDAIFRNGQYTDVLLFGLTAGEWKAGCS